MANINIKLSKEQQQYLVAGVLFVGGGGFAFFNYFWLPTSKQIVETEQKIKAIQAKILKAKGNAGKLDKIQKELALLNKKAEEAEKRLPKAEDFPTVVDTITDLAKKYNVELRSFSTGTSSDQTHFIVIKYKLNGSATYDDWGRFFASLALQERIYNVENVNFSPAGNGVSVSFDLLTYKYKG